ncbi:MULTISPECIES: HlyD family secretion protein [unclassified Colwellia]|uniref:HlyD family secretion protein n=1 Tax=unclassified Colwellia TaxID=196834 RepID=UPI0015F65FF0|nr:MULTISPECIES: HlyD family efflux transporter periplasmic adaptor subunit [unclassified Colwellia]MBA6346803.1 HlyD family efflux transporter periplasmic adaptor subunit [Colwellia sp. BRX8-9]MBA6380241.1 HlyD family efflux transporter periplasmic adaptor subunit [Colwellia sp. BRX10-7]MBA6387453.1 HlyD family efflux transporter periplasmic adaptor subunit [Colwellia sp. BRX10-2]MBA6402540.1 HlyD family efflux transporter periplasmic adaptor subunit [Colwellia sp. BRX10-5]MBA6406675.1 HlyD f|tara:strand:+ start:2801 stop:4054 length:1254 start_codon:yes stop_codon:yes gene_type:complete
MDVKKVKTKQSKLKSMPVYSGVAIFLLAALTWYVSTQTGGTSVKRDDMLFGTVKHGDLQVEIEGYGALRSDKQVLITSLTSATVQEIVLKPGALVTADSIIIQLANPELQQQVDSAVRELSQQKANLRQLKLNQKREILNESGNFAELEARYETAKVKLEAQSGLVKSGIVSVLDYKESFVQEAQLNKRIKIHKQRTTALKLVNQEAINIQNEQIMQQQGQLDIAQNRLERLTVKAGFDGVLQRLSVELGQSLAAGQEIALIGSVENLIALVRVPQSKAQQIFIGQKAIVDTRRDKIVGTVSRIDPVVVDNTVEVEIALPDQLPASARPQLSVDAVIITETLANITYMERPVNGLANSNSSLFLLDDSNNAAIRTKVEFGKEAGRYIQIIKGGKVNDIFIVSDLSLVKNSELTIDSF